MEQLQVKAGQVGARGTRVGTEGKWGGDDGVGDRLHGLLCSSSCEPHSPPNKLSACSRLVLKSKIRHFFFFFLDLSK